MERFPAKIRPLLPEERRAIKGAIRRSFRFSPTVKQTLRAARIEMPRIKKDGTPSKKVRVFYKCAVCQNLFQGTNVQVDHIDPVVPLDMKEEDMTPNLLVSRVYCPIENLQVICSTKIKHLPIGQRSCHYKKSSCENFIRSKMTSEGGTIEHWEAVFRAEWDSKIEKLVEKERKKQERLCKKKKT